MFKPETQTPQVKEAEQHTGRINLSTSPSSAEQEQPRVFKRARKEKGSTAKDRISKIPPCAPGKRSSIYRGVTRHRWTGRYEAHLWDKSTWNATQKKKGKQVYLGAYDEEESAARAYDLAALKYWGQSTLTNFPVTDYTKDIEEMQNVSREEYLACLRRKSSGFSRGVSKYRGVARHHHNGRWEARIGRVFGNKYLYLGTYSTQEEAAAAYDMAAIEYRGLNAVTNFDLSRYIRWLRPGNMGSTNTSSTDQSNTKNQEGGSLCFDGCNTHNSMPSHSQKWGFDSSISQFSPSTPSSFNSHNNDNYSTPSSFNSHNDNYSNMLNTTSASMHPSVPFTQQKSSGSPTALSLLLQSNLFRQMLEKTTAASHHPPPSPAAMESSVLQDQFSLNNDENDVEIDYKDLFLNSTHFELSNYDNKEVEVVLNDYTIDYQDATCHETLNNHQHMSKMFQNDLQITTDIYSSPTAASVFDSYTSQRSPHYTLNLNEIIDDDQEGQDHILGNEDVVGLNLWGNVFRSNDGPPASVALSRCRSGYQEKQSHNETCDTYYDGKSLI